MKTRLLFLCVSLLTVTVMNVSAADWPDWRGPLRDGVSVEKNLPEKWSRAGLNLAWKRPFGGRSTPVILGNRLYAQNSVGKGATQQERVLCLDTATGRVIWEHRLKLF